MNTKHTPGPWSVQPDPERAGKHPYHDNRFIARGLPDITSDEWMHDPNSYIICVMRDCQNQKANARLIAAAPELLEACKALLAADQAICDNVGTKSDQAMNRIAAIDSARAAIAKAEPVKAGPVIHRDPDGKGFTAIL